MTELIGDCYRIEGELGQGGMARVFRVLDERSGQRFALKQLVSSERHATMQAMFEREYHTLVQLVHPHIVRVFDYGLHRDQPYYTMELLEGTDVRRASKTHGLDVREVCLLLRDAASALALIHSRRFVHRDVSPRNLWCTTDRRAKLIDFGTLVAMGPQSRAAGTAPFVPPEAVHMQPLDGRCDLYALGALGYLLLTHHNAYPAREIGELRQAWRRRPKRPDTIDPRVPKPLADLVMALLSLDPRGRPASAAEVVERLTAIAELPHEDDPHLAQSFLISPTLVGRDAANAFLRKRLTRARQGRHGAVAIVAPAGLGRSRMLESCVLEAKLMGASAIAVDAAAAGPEAFALAGLLAERLLETVPFAAASAIDVAPVLANLSPELRLAFGSPAAAQLTSLDATSKLAAAFVTLFATVSRDHHLLVAVDDVHRGDSASLAVLARIAALRAGRLLLVTTCDEAALGGPSPLLDQLIGARDRLALEPLTQADTRALLGSLFDDVAGLDTAAAWLHELSQGSPQTCMQYAQYLVDHGLARYEDGRWRLPERLREQALPTSLGAMLEARLQHLSEDARTLALGLALARDESRALWQPEKHVAVEAMPTLLDAAVTAHDARGTSHAARAFCALDELLRAGVVQQRDDRYAVGQSAMIEVLLRTSDEELRRAMHLRLANTFSTDGRIDLSMVRHLQRAGDHVRARELLLASSEQVGSGAIDWGAVRVSVTSECAQVAYAHWQVHGGAPREGVLLRRMLLLTCSAYDWSNTRFVDAQLAQLRADCGLVHWDATDVSRPPLERVLECLKRAQQTYERTPEHERGLAPGDAVRELAATAMTVCGALANCYEVAAVRGIAELLVPLRALSPAIALIIDLALLGIDRAIGAEMGDRMLDRAARAEQHPELSDVLRKSTGMMSRYTQAILDARQGRARALELAEQFMPGVGDEMFLVAHARWLCHAFRGRAELAAPYRKRVELVTEDDVWRRKACLFVEAELFALTGDLPGLERTAASITALADAFPGWNAWRRATRAAIHQLRGELAEAQAELEAALALAPAGEHRAWVHVAPALAEVRFARGDVGGALRDVAEITRAIAEHSLNRNAAVAAERVRALCESSRGDHAAAREAIGRAFAIAAELGFDGLPLAQLHETHARVLLAAGDANGCAGALGVLHDLIAHADAPALIQAYEALRAENPQLAVPELSAASPATQQATSDASELWTEVSTLLGALDQRAARAHRALALLIEDSGASGGHLFLYDGKRVSLAASSAGVAGEHLQQLAQRHLEAERDASEGSTITTSAMTPGRSTRPRPLVSQDPIPLVLSVEIDGEMLAIGVALLAPAPGQRRPRNALVRAVGRCLQLHGDGVPLPPAGTQAG